MSLRVQAFFLEVELALHDVQRVVTDFPAVAQPDELAPLRVDHGVLAAATSTSRNRVAIWIVSIGYRVRARRRRSCASAQRLRSSSVAHSRRGTGTGRRSSSIATIVK